MSQQSSKRSKKKSGFSLLEMAIVLIAIGILVAGIIGGRILVVQAQLRSVISGTADYTVAVRSFVLEYEGMPGDMSDISSLLAGATDCTNDAISPNNSICGDNFVGDEDATSLESVLFFNNLSVAGFIDGSFNGSKPGDLTAGSGNIEIGTNYPSVGVGNNTYYFAQSGTMGGLYARANRIAITSTDFGAGLSPANAFFIDSKIDNGLPLTGSFVAFNVDSNGVFAQKDNDSFGFVKTAYAAVDDCTTQDLSSMTSAGEAASAVYNVDDDTAECQGSTVYNAAGEAESAGMVVNLPTVKGCLSVSASSFDVNAIDNTGSGVDGAVVNLSCDMGYTSTLSVSCSGGDESTNGTWTPSGSCTATGGCSDTPLTAFAEFIGLNIETGQSTGAGNNGDIYVVVCGTNIVPAQAAGCHADRPLITCTGSSWVVSNENDCESIHSCPAEDAANYLTSAVGIISTALPSGQFCGSGSFTMYCDNANDYHYVGSSDPESSALCVYPGFPAGGEFDIITPGGWAFDDDMCALQNDCLGSAVSGGYSDTDYRECALSGDNTSIRKCDTGGNWDVVGELTFLQSNWENGGNWTDGEACTNAFPTQPNCPEIPGQYVETPFSECAQSSLDPSQMQRCNFGGVWGAMIPFDQTNWNNSLCSNNVPTQPDCLDSAVPGIYGDTVYLECSQNTSNTAEMRVCYAGGVWSGVLVHDPAVWSANCANAFPGP